MGGPRTRAGPSRGATRRCARAYRLNSAGRRRCRRRRCTRWRCSSPPPAPIRSRLVTTGWPAARSASAARCRPGGTAAAGLQVEELGHGVAVGHRPPLAPTRDERLGRPGGGQGRRRPASASPSTEGGARPLSTRRGRRRPSARWPGQFSSAARGSRRRTGSGSTEPSRVTPGPGSGKGRRTRCRGRCRRKTQVAELSGRRGRAQPVQVAGGVLGAHERAGSAARAAGSSARTGGLRAGHP